MTSSPVFSTIGSASPPIRELRSLEVGDHGDRAAELVRHLADARGALRMLLVRAVREVEPGGVHAGGDERAQLLDRVRRRSERRDDLRPAFRHHAASVAAARRGLRFFARGNAAQPGYSALPPSRSSIRSSWLYFATRSERAGEPVLIWPAPSATARSAIVVSSVSPERCEITVV